MATNILMPALSPTMTEGTLARWLKKEGDAVKAGDIIAEIETDKATMEVEAVDEGVLGKILVADGTEGVKVNDPIAVLVEAGEAVPSAAPGAPRRRAGAAPSRRERRRPAARPRCRRRSSRRLPAPRRRRSTRSRCRRRPTAMRGRRVFASPLARRMAQQAGLDLGRRDGQRPGRPHREGGHRGGAGQGPARRSPRRRPPRPHPRPPPAPKPGAAPAPAVTAPHTAVPNSTMRKVIARRLAESKQTIPHFYVTMDIEIDALLKLRADLNAKSPKDGPGAFKLSVNDLVIKAAAATLRRFPNVNATWTDDGDPAVRRRRHLGRRLHPRRA